MTLPSSLISEATHPLEKILKAGGILGLISVMLVGFLMAVVYQGQRDMQAVHMQLVDLQREQLEQEKENGQTLTDIRYLIRADNGITMRQR